MRNLIGSYIIIYWLNIPIYNTVYYKQDRVRLTGFDISTPGSTLILNWFAFRSGPSLGPLEPNQAQYLIANPTANCITKENFCFNLASVLVGTYR